MQATRYQTGHDPDQIARDAIDETHRKHTYAEQAAQTALIATAAATGVSETPTDAVLARAAAPHIAAIVLREAASPLWSQAQAAQAGGYTIDVRDAARIMHDLADECDPVDCMIARGEYDATRYDLGGERD